MAKQIGEMETSGRRREELRTAGDRCTCTRAQPKEVVVGVCSEDRAWVELVLGPMEVLLRAWRIREASIDKDDVPTDSCDATELCFRIHIHKIRCVGDSCRRAWLVALC